MSNRVPSWIRTCTILLLLVQMALLPLLFLGPWKGSGRNFLVQVMIAGIAALLALGAYSVRYHGEALPTIASRHGLAALLALAVMLVGFYGLRVSPFLAMPYDLGSWSEPMFVVDLVKLRSGVPLYTAAGDSNSNTYTPGTPILSYFLAWLCGQPTSIVFYRWLLQFYLTLAAVFAGLSAWRILGLAIPERFASISRLWLPFFVLASFLLAVNPDTGIFVVFLHNDPLALLATALAFWVMVQHAATGRRHWLWAMAVVPALAFLVKQYLAIWLVAYGMYLLLSGREFIRRTLAFAAISAGLLVATVALCYAAWGEPFVYWVFGVMGEHTISFERLLAQFSNSALFILLGVLGGLCLLRGLALPRLLGLWAAWIPMVLGAQYTSGITFHPSHYGPATLVGACFFLAALGKAWSTPETSGGHGGRQLLETSLVFAGVLLLLGAMHLTIPQRNPSSPDLFRYAHQIEAEFQGLPPESILLDVGDWVYLERGVVMTDRATIRLTHRATVPDLVLRVRRQAFRKILIRELAEGAHLYDVGVQRGFMQALQTNYREVRRIPRVDGMDSWQYQNMMLSEVLVFEPIPPTEPASR